MLRRPRDPSMPVRRGAGRAGRLLAVVAAAAALLLLAGCGGGASPEDASGAAGRTGSTGPAERVDVLAASSLAAVLPQLVEGFERARPGTTVEVSSGASNALVEQVRAGAPADVVLSADRATADRAAAALGGGASSGRNGAEPVPFANTTLVVAVPATNPGGVRSLSDLARPGLLVGLCAPQVPCGAYARDLLRAAGVEASVDTEEPDARSLMAKIASGDLDAGLVYRTEARAAGSAVGVVEVPESGDVPVTYYAVVRSAGRGRGGDRGGDRSGDRGGADFVTYLQGPGRAVLSGAGFGVP